jgi:hypothetical protein
MADIPQGITVKSHLELQGRGWHVWVRRALLAVVAAVPVVALFNVFGQQPLTSRAADPRAVLSVSSPDRVRGGLLYTADFRVYARRE